MTSGIKTVEQIKNEFQLIQIKLDPNSEFDHFFQIPTSPQLDTSTHLELHDGEYHIVSTERGSVYNIEKTKNSDDVLYFFTSVAIYDIVFATKTNSSEVEIAKRIDMLKTIDREWAERAIEKFTNLYPDEMDEWLKANRKTDD